MPQNDNEPVPIVEFANAVSRSRPMLMIDTPIVDAFPLDSKTLLIDE